MLGLGLDWSKVDGNEWLLGSVGSRLFERNESGVADAVMMKTVLWGLGPGSL